MNLVPYSSSHHPLLAKWWSAWKLPITPPHWLGDGLVAGEQTPICAGFLFRLGHSPLWWIEGIVSDPEASKEARGRALGLLVEGLYKEAKVRGAELVMGSTPREGLGAIFKELGFNPAPEKYQHLGRQ